MALFEFMGTLQWVPPEGSQPKQPFDLMAGYPLQ
jgi:hypothetical protein